MLQIHWYFPLSSPFLSFKGQLRPGRVFTQNLELPFVGSFSSGIPPLTLGSYLLVPSPENYRSLCQQPALNNNALKMANSLVAGPVFQVASTHQSLLAFVHFVETLSSCFPYSLSKCRKVGLLGPYAINLEVS